MGSPASGPECERFEGSSRLREVAVSFLDALFKAGVGRPPTGRARRPPGVAGWKVSCTNPARDAAWALGRQGRPGAWSRDRPCIRSLVGASGASGPGTLWATLRGVTRGSGAVRGGPVGVSWQPDRDVVLEMVPPLTPS